MVNEAFGELDEIIAAGVHPTRFTCALHGGQDQARQRADDRDDDQHLDEGEGTAATNTMRFDDVPLDKLTMNPPLDERKLAHDPTV